MNLVRIWQLWIYKHVIWWAISTIFIKVVLHKRRGVEVKVNEPCCENDRVVDSRNLIGWSGDRSHLSEAESLSKWKDLDLQASTQWTNMISPLTRLPDTQKTSNPEQTVLSPNFFTSIVCGLDHPEFSWLYIAQLWTAIGTKGHPDHHAFEKEDDDDDDDDDDGDDDGDDEYQAGLIL